MYNKKQKLKTKKRRIKIQLFLNYSRKLKIKTTCTRIIIAYKTIYK